MQYIYTFIISFILIFLSELGDKTQILVLSFSAKNKTSSILLGVALGTFLSHGIAIICGSKLSYINNDCFIYYLKLCTYFTFLIFGFLGFIKLKKSVSTPNIKTDSNFRFIKFITSLSQNCIFLVASSIAIGEIGDKTFLASLGLGIQYPLYKISLILGSIFGMVISNSFAIFFGKWISKNISNNIIEILSNIIFILFGILGIINIVLP